MKKKELDADTLAQKLAAEEANASNTEESPLPTLGKSTDHYHDPV